MAALVRTFGRFGWSGLGIVVLMLLGAAGCTKGDSGDLRVDNGERDGGPRPDASTGDAGAADAELEPPLDGSLDAALPGDGGVEAGSDARADGGSEAGHDSGPDSGFDGGLPDSGPDSGCGNAKLCEQFEGYTSGPLADGTMLGPWRVRVLDRNATASIDPTRAVSGTRSLKVHIDRGATSGAQLLTRAPPLFQAPRTTLYGRFMMYLGPAGTSIHWTMFGASGVVPQGTTTAGATATYMFGAFDDDTGRNIFADVYTNSLTDQDCWHGSNQLMPVFRWTCVAFMIDSPMKRYRMWLDGAPVASMSVDGMGDGCVDMENQPWWGPLFDELYIGTLTFHPMEAPIDLWIDDIVVDTAPVSCP